ncbi:TPA: hypothetical protein N0F65_009112 [Lagenidium giganteum]|uniref:Uncharacterized protein n=1 Tax=Lagenidium giganteum TaxID=4803 RepID=A0AAV2YPM8_9STRA|nr:TPA: hypothetical protein N0F65_009112 [Lagenidium giganteum]
MSRGMSRPTARLRKASSGRRSVKINTFETDDSESSSDEAIVFDKFTMNASEDQVHMVVNERELVRKAGTVDDKHVTIMLDSGATSNMIRPGLAERVTAVRQTQIQRFDGTWTQPAPMKKVEAQVTMDGHDFGNMEFTELSDNHDVIFGNPWFTQHQPNARSEDSCSGISSGSHGGGLATIEYAHSMLVHSSTNLSPFEFDTGRKKCKMFKDRTSQSQTMRASLRRIDES